MNQENIGKFIAECRKGKNMTQRELAEKVGVTDRAISNWENGRRLPDLSLISLVANELDVSVAELLNGRKLNKEELEELKTTIDKLLEYNTVEEIKKIKKINGAFTLSFIFIVLAVIINEINFSSDIFNFEVAASYLLGLGVGIGLLAIINNYMKINKQKDNLVSRLKKRANTKNK